MPALYPQRSFLKFIQEDYMKIGAFIQSPDGSLIGRIHGLGFKTVAVAAEPQTSRDGKRYFRLIADPTKDVYEIGLAFPREKDGKLYYSVSIDSPMFPQPINAALFQDKGNPGVFNLIWNRPEAQGLKPEVATQPLRRNDSQQHITL
jgi:uncharacterized protein (DUF736 family)